MINKLGNAADAWRLAWKFDIYAHDPISRDDIYVDVETGEVIFRNPSLHTADVNGTAETKYSGLRDIVTDSTAPGMYRLRESGRGSGVQTWNMLTGTNYGNAVDFEDTDNYWNNVNADKDEIATDAHWGAEMTYDYFMQEHSRNSYDDNGALLLSYVHYGQSFANAFWDGFRMTYGDGGNGIAPLTALDICGHEFAHGVTGNSANLIYQDEMGALNESFSDIWGTAIEFFARPNDANWLIGDDIGAFRSMAQPGVFSDPDTYHGQNWFWGSGDNGGVHTNSGVQNYWFHLLSAGGSGTNDNGDPFSVDGISLDTAGHIAYRNLNVYLTATSEYIDARYYAIESAIDLYGPCSNPMIQTMNAWQAVGVGPAFSAIPDAGFFTEDSVVCSAPAQVSFTDQSTGAIAWFWDFGDGGTTSTQPNPTYVYNNYGNYTVTLIVTGCNNVQDTLIMQQAVQVDQNLICPVSLDWMNTNGSYNACNGELYDSGGTLDYVNNSAAVLTINTTPGTFVTLDFQSFEYAAGDALYLYDGPSVTSPLIGVFGGTNSPGVVNSTSNVLTVRESTNAFNTRPGFHAIWSCNPLSTEAPSEVRFDVFPNPARDHATVTWSGL
ncbi:MAG: M4 family metallopeptidase, partial [Bacteroidota bacterium]